MDEAHIELMKKIITALKSKKTVWTDKIAMIKSIDNDLVQYNIFINLKNTGIKREDMIRRQAVLEMGDEHLKGAMKADPDFFKDKEVEE